MLRKTRTHGNVPKPAAVNNRPKRNVKISKDKDSQNNITNMKSDVLRESPDIDDAGDKLPSVKQRVYRPSAYNEDYSSSSGSSDEGGLETTDVVSKQSRNVKYFAEQCILSNTKGRPKTSDNTLSSLKANKLDFGTLHLLVKSTVVSHCQERSVLLREYEECTDKWLCLMQEGFNLMFYGVGSKLSFIEKVFLEKLRDKDTVVLHGFYPGLTPKQILNSITEEILNHQGTFSSLHAQAKFITEKLRSDLYLIIHNMDGPILSTERVSTVLCELAKCDKIHYIATVDHVNSGLLWNSTSASCFKFLWFDITNFLPYSMENAYENSFLLKQNNTLALSSLQHVFRSLTPNAQGIFMLLAKAQLEQQDSQMNGLPFKDLYHLCREAFLVNSELTLETQLTEFKDHNMIRLRRGPEGLEYLQVAVNTDTLKEFVSLPN